MNKHVVQGLIALAGLTSTVSVACAQAGGAPQSAQVWDVRFVADTSGPFAAGPSATAVGITLVARVGIRANTSTFGTANFGVSRIGAIAGSPNSFQIAVTDALSAAGGLNQGSLTRGQTAVGQFAEAPRNDADGNVPAEGAPLSGTFYPWRAGFSFGGLPNPGSNNDQFNGTYSNPATGSPNFRLWSVDRSRGWNTVPTPLGVATLDAAGNITGGDYAALYRFVYLPRADFTVNSVRNVTISMTGATGRYIFALAGDSGLSSGPTPTVPPQLGTQFVLPTPIELTFQVPGPGAAALAGLAGIAALRRRR